MVTEAGTELNSAENLMQFTVMMYDPCFDIMISLAGVVPDLAPSYTITDSASVYLFDTLQTYDGPEVNTFFCPAFEYTLVN